MLLTFFPLKTANALIIYRNDLIAFDLPDIQDQKSLTPLTLNFRMGQGA